MPINSLNIMLLTSRNIHILLKAFKTYVLPILEYASSVWSPHQKLNICKSEQVKRKFTKHLPGCGCLSYASRLAKLKLNRLEVRQLKQDLVLTNKIIYGLTAFCASDYF